MATRPENDMGEITGLLRELEAGAPNARERLCEAVYQDLRQLARVRFQLREHTLQPTALVHEAWVRIGKQRQVPRDRTHFFRIAAEVMLRVLRDYARYRGAVKRGAGRERLDWTVAVMDLADEDVDQDQLCDAIEDLRQAHERSAQVVQLRVFGGMTHGEIAAALETSVSTVEREWRAGKAWLTTQLRQEPSC